MGGAKKGYPCADLVPRPVDFLRGTCLCAKMAVSARGSLSLGHRIMKALGSFAPKHSGHEKLGTVLCSSVHVRTCGFL